MTKKQAKKLCIEVWEYFRDHPEVQRKEDLPNVLYQKIRKLTCLCPLCELFYFINCSGCPLNSCETKPGLWWKWVTATTDKTRAKYSSAIVEKVKAWKV